MATDTLNPDSVGDIGQDNSDARVGATDPDDSDSMLCVGQSDVNAGVGATGLDNSDSGRTPDSLTESL